MAAPQAVEATPAEAAEMVRATLNLAYAALHMGDPDTACDRYAQALGLALQLGPGPVTQVLCAALGAAQELAGGDWGSESGISEGSPGSSPLAAGHPGAEALSALGPALVDVTDQVREAGALPETPTMDAWALVASGIGALVGHLGVALTIPAERGAGVTDVVRAHADALDEVTGGLFALRSWLDEAVPSGTPMASPGHLAPG
jgi:hypothetical protein